MTLIYRENISVELPPRSPFLSLFRLLLSHLPRRPPTQPLQYTHHRLPHPLLSQSRFDHHQPLAPLAPELRPLGRRRRGLDAFGGGEVGGGRGGEEGEVGEDVGGVDDLVETTKKRRRVRRRVRGEG